MKKIFSIKNIIAFLLAGIVIAFPEMTFAFKNESETLKGLAEILGLIIQVFTFIALWMMSFFGKLLGTELLTGPEAIQTVTPMWVWVRNLTNILFVVVLVGLAFTNLYSSFSKEGGGNWSIKEKLPKVIIALVAINFSLLGFKVVIDAVNVGTVAILSIADSRLDIDNPDQQDAMIAAKTWVKVKEDVYNSFKDRKVDYTGKVKTGESCTKEYKELSEDQKKANKVLRKKDGDKYYVCRDFRSQINDMFCGDWEKIATKNEDGKEKDVSTDDLGDDCYFLLKDKGFKSMLSPDDEPGQNLFTAFATTFVHLERMPALAASINSLEGVLINALFSAILGLAYLFALVAVFIALIARVVVIWLALAFSPVLIAAAIMGFGGQGEASKISENIVTFLIMPLKIAAAFAVSFVMMSAMIEFNVEGGAEGAFVFGPALSQLGTIGTGSSEYGLVWQIATIVIFWMAAKWAVKNDFSSKITDYIFTGAEILGMTAARAATIDRQIFTVPGGKKGEQYSMSNVFGLPMKYAAFKERENTNRGTALSQSLFGASDFQKKLLEEDFNGENAKDKFMGLAPLAASIGAFNASKSEVLDKLAKGESAFAEAFTKFATDSKHKNKSLSNMVKDFGKDREYNKNGMYMTAEEGERFANSGFYTGKSSPINPAKPDGEDEPVKDIITKDKEGNITIENQKLSDIHTKGWTNNGNSISMGATNYADIEDNGGDAFAEFKNSVENQKPAKIINNTTDYYKTINSGSKGNENISLAESKNGVLKVATFDRTGKKFIDLSTNTGGSYDKVSGATSISINNSFVTKFKSSYMDNDGKIKDNLSKEAINELRTFKELEKSKFISKNAASGLTSADKTFIESLANIELPQEVTK